MLNKMSTLLITLVGLTVGSTDPCTVGGDISPCTCRLEDPKFKRIVVACERMSSFADVVGTIAHRFPPEQDITLKINYSRLTDMSDRSFEELGMRVRNLRLSFDDLSQLPESTFSGLGEVEYFSLADNRLLEIPRAVLRKMPKLKTFDLGRSRISNLWNEDFQDLPLLQHLLLPGNLLSKIESGAFPKTMRRMHIGRNSLKSLNGSLRALTDLEWLFINENQLTNLHEELPSEAPKLSLLHAAYNHIPKLPAELRNYTNIDALFLSHNDIASLDGILQKARRLRRLDLSYNKLHTLADDDLAESELMEDVQLGHNYIKHLNKSFLPMRKLRVLNLSHNYLSEFSFEVIRGLKNLRLLDLSHNKISHLNGRMENAVEVETGVEVLMLDHNEIKALGRSLMGIHGLQRLSLSHNKLMNIAPDDLIGLEDLKILDISHNHLTTLEETSKTFLPRLQELIANNNLLQTLEKDFHGLPVLCKADLSNNQITSIGTDLISKTRCKVDGAPGVLRIYLYDNPVLCDPDFKITADYMEANFTILQGDFSICPTIVYDVDGVNETIESTTTTTTPQTSTATSTTMASTTSESQPKSVAEPVLIASQLLINQQPVPFPILIASQMSESPGGGDDDDGNNSKVPPRKDILIADKVPRFDILTAEMDASADNVAAAPGNGSGSNADAGDGEEDTGKSVDGNILESVLIHAPPIVVKEESPGNVTLFIPVENGALGKDHVVVDELVRKASGSEVGDLASKGKVHGLIPDIDIVQIKQLPDDPPPGGKAGGGNGNEAGN